MSLLVGEVDILFLKYFIPYFYIFIMYVYYRCISVKWRTKVLQSTTLDLKLTTLLLTYTATTNGVVTCEIKLFQYYFSLRRRPYEIILFQRVETCLKLFQMFASVYEYFPTCSLSPKIILKIISAR